MEHLQSEEPFSSDPYFSVRFKKYIKQHMKFKVNYFQKWYFVTKIVLTYCEKKLDREKTLKFEAEGREFAKKIKIMRTIYLNNERSVQFLLF